MSIFSLSGSNAQDGHLAAGRNGVKRLRTVSSACYILTSHLMLHFFLMEKQNSVPFFLMVLFFRLGIQIYCHFFTVSRSKRLIPVLQRSQFIL